MDWPLGELRGQMLPVSTDEPFVRGDCDGDGQVNALADAIFLLSFGFLEGNAPLCKDAADVDDDGTVNALVDGLRLLTHGFVMGEPPAAPYPGCGIDAAPDALTCVVYGGCP